MPAASYALLPNLKKGLFFAIGEGSRIFCRLFSTHQRPNVSGRRPPPITGRFVNAVTRGWVGVPNERALFRFHGAVVGFVDGCLSRTRNLTASNQHLAEFFLGRSWLKRPRSCFFGFFEKFEKKMKICTHSERNRNLLARIFEIRVSIGTGLSVFLGCRN